MFQTANGWLKTFTDFGVSVIFAGIVIDILFAQSYVTGNIGEMVKGFSEQGIAGFIALLLFVVYWQRKSPTTTT